MADAPSTPPFTHLVNLASPRLGTQVIAVSDEFFGPGPRMLQDPPAVFIPDKYDDHGKWMDGWETRRRRNGGFDHAVVRLGVAGIIRGVDIDTSHFTGNFPPAASIEAAAGDSDPGAWEEIVPPTPLGASAHHYIAVNDTRPWRWLRLNIFPDGGVARLRVYGDPVPSWEGGAEKGVHELSALKNGGRIVAYNNAHYGTTWTLLTEGRGLNMGDGWETRRRREPGNDWIIVALGARGIVEAVEIDTCHFKGNYPDRCSLQAADASLTADAGLVTQAMFWPTLMGERKLAADTIHDFDKADLEDLGPVTHVKLNIFPDGGVSRLRIFGRLA